MYDRASRPQLTGGVIRVLFMNEETKQHVVAVWRTLPDGCRKPPATSADVLSFEAQFGPIPLDYRWFLENCGGGTVGSYWVDDIRALCDTHIKFSQEYGVPNGWTMDNVFAIGWDAGGNPFGIHRDTGKILLEDHDFGGILELASSFEDFLVTGLNSKGNV